MTPCDDSCFDRAGGRPFRRAMFGPVSALVSRGANGQRFESSVAARRARGDRSRPMTTKGSKGIFVSLDPHPLAVRDEPSLRELVGSLDGPLVVDLFCGAGGLSLGLERAGGTTIVGIDHDEHAIRTHRAHHLGLSESWDLSDPAVVETIGRIVREHEVTLVCGGPPCQPFSRAGRGIIRSLVDRGVRGQRDERRDLWQSFLEVVRIGRPAAVLMENVPDMAFDRGMVIIRSVIAELESWGYGVDARVLDSSAYGVPQTRRRLFVIGLRDGVQPRWPDAAEHRTSLVDAIGDLPPFDGGWVHDGLDDTGGMPYEAASSTFQELMRRDCGPVVFDQITRAVRPDDRLAFAAMEPGTKYSELDDDLKRYRDDIFQDKYNRLDPFAPSRTVTAHLSRDGYAYIHPFEDRTISVREAARIQSFPDNIRFHGPPTSAFRQIGNAVPVLMGEALGLAILAALDDGQTATTSVSQSTSMLASYFHARSSGDDLAVEWLAAGSTWQLVLGVLLESVTNPKHRRIVWDLVRGHLTPIDSLDARDPMTRVGRQLGIEALINEVLSIAEKVVDGEDLASVLSHRVWDSVCTLSADEDEAFVPTPGMVRVAARFFGVPLETLSVGTTGRLLTARLAGGTDSDQVGADAARGLYEIAATICSSDRPSCSRCPLSDHCAGAVSDELTLELGAS